MQSVTMQKSVNARRKIVTWYESIKLDKEQNSVGLFVSCVPPNSAAKSERIRNSLSVLTAIFPGEPGLASFLEAKNNGSGGDNWSCKSCKAPVKLLPQTSQYPTFLQARCPSCRPTNSVKALKGKIPHFTDMLTQMVTITGVIITGVEQCTPLLGCSAPSVAESSASRSDEFVPKLVVLRPECQQPPPPFLQSWHPTCHLLYSSSMQNFCALP